MAEDTQNTDTQAEGLAALGAISADAPVSVAPAAPAEPKSTILAVHMQQVAAKMPLHAYG